MTTFLARGRVSLEITSGCTACGACLATCPEHALRAAPYRPRVLTGRCTGCGECVEICPRDAINLCAIDVWRAISLREISLWAMSPLESP